MWGSELEESCFHKHLVEGHVCIYAYVYIYVGAYTLKYVCYLNASSYHL